jgi:hypothetical protein
VRQGAGAPDLLKGMGRSSRGMGSSKRLAGGRVRRQSWMDRRAGRVHDGRLCTAPGGSQGSRRPTQILTTLHRHCASAQVPEAPDEQYSPRPEAGQTMAVGSRRWPCGAKGRSGCAGALSATPNRARHCGNFSRHQP